MAVIATTVTGVFVLVAIIIIVGVVATVLPHNSVPTPDVLCATVVLRTAEPDATPLTRPACAPARITGTGHGATALAAAARWLGTPYSWGGGALDGPSRGIDQGANTVGFDCSALTRYAWHQAGVALPRTAAEQWHALRHIGPGYRAPGDLVFFQGSGGGPNHPGHVGLVRDTDRMIEAPRTGLRVRISRYTVRQDIIGYARPGS
ncbi:C40 family peptidase [Nonomuraea longispora]|nr:NlpC/P60 family protein [Nonomuraea longispora]